MDTTKKSLVTGATGLVGTRLVRALGPNVAVLSRDAKKAERAIGVQAFDWDGTSTSGLSAAAGKYTITVDALDATGAKVAVDTKVSGVVDGVDLSGSEPVLTIGSARVPASSVKSLTTSGS